MAKRVYVGNLAWATTEDGLREIFGQYGEVVSARIITDRETGRSKGFAFVEMEGADAAIAALNGVNLDGRPLRVNEANERPAGERSGGRSGGGGFGGGGRSGGRSGGGYGQQRDY